MCPLPITSGAPVITSFSYDRRTGVFTCNSTGGIVREAAWRSDFRSSDIFFFNGYDGGPYQAASELVDPIAITYVHTLTISSSSLTDYTGDFRCEVRNSKGSDTSNYLRLTGKPEPYDLMFTIAELLP